MSLAIYEREKIRITAMIREERERHERALKGLRAELELVATNATISANGIDDSKVLHAEHVIYVRGNFEKAGEDRVGCREAAIADILQGGRRLKTEAFGTKNYAHWHGQRSDHGYGYGPKHGSIIFQIGLIKPVLEREGPLTEEEIESAVYYLRNLERIQAAQATAALHAAAA